jgi:hypothetical protein
VLAQFFDRVASTHGDFADAFSVALHTTIGLVVAALLLGVVDLVRRQRADRGPTAHH